MPTATILENSFYLILFILGYLDSVNTEETGTVLLNTYLLRQGGVFIQILCARV